ncbi:MAG: hypothetical protein EZS28_014192, partial [Streblomastix strix]
QKVDSIAMELIYVGELDQQHQDQFLHETLTFIFELSLLIPNPTLWSAYRQDDGFIVSASSLVLLIFHQSATPLSDGTAIAGISTEYSRGDHVHPLSVTTTIPPRDSANGSVGTTNQYARNDHCHPLNITTSISSQDSANGSVGTTNYYAGNYHSHPINVETNASNIPIVNGVGADGTSSFYARHDHVHPQQLTYDGNVTAPKFIKADNKLSRTYTGSGWVRLQLYYTVNGITTVYGVFTAPNRVTSYYFIDNGANQLFRTHNGSSAATIYSAYIRLETVGSITVVVTDQSTYYSNRITEILTQDVVSSVPSGTQIPINYNFGYEGILQNTLQVNPTERMKSNYNNGIRIGSYVSESSLYLACSNSTISGTVADQWKISKTSDDALTINPSSQRQADHSVGLGINSDSSKITINGNELVNVGADQTTTGIKTFAGVVCSAAQINPTTANYSQGLRISRIAAGCVIYILELVTEQTEHGAANRGLRISADENTLSFNGSVIAGTGAISGESNGSIQYSAGNPILWGLNSTGTEGGFYSNGTNICWRARPITLGSVPP